MPGKNIDNLNFKVILDDKDFNDRIQKDIKAAKDLNVQLSQLLQAKVKINTITAQEAASAKRASDILAKQAIDQERIRKAAELAAAAEEKKRTQAEKTNNEIKKGVTESAKAAKEQQRTATEAQRTAAAANQAAVNAQRLRTEQQRTATEAQRTATATQNTANATARAELAQRRLRDYSSQTARHIQTQSRLMNELKGYALGYLSIHGASRLLSSLVRVTGEFELQKTTLAAMLGDLNAAEGIITRIQGLAVESPFQFKELTTYAKQLSAFSVPAQELYDTTKMLADVSAGLGVGMDRIVLAYGQVRSAAFLRGQEVRQFTEAGIPILNELAKQFTELEGRAVSAGEVFDKISARLVPFEMVAKVFKDMTSEGGKFYNMQEVQAETLRGKISNLKDAYEVMLNEIGSKKSGTLKGAVDSVRALMQNWERVGSVLKTIIVTYGAYKATLGAIWAVEKAIQATRSVALYQILTTERNVKKANAAYRAFGVTLKQINKMGAGIAVGAILGVVTAITTAIRKAGELRRELESIMSAEFSNSDKMVNELDRLVGNLKKANQGSQEYRETISELNRKYGEYLPNILTEADSYAKVEAAANAAAIAIRNKAKANAFEKGSAAIEDDLGSKLTKRTSAFRSALTNMPSISKDAANEFIKNFNLALAEDGAMDDIEKTLRDSFDSYFGKGKFEEYEMSFALGTLVFDAKEYAEVRDKVIQAEKDLQDDLDARFDGAAFSSLNEREEVSKIEKWYRDELSNNDDALKKLTLTQDEYNRKVEELDIEKLRKLVATYKELGRDDIAKQYQAQLDEMLKVPDGWRGKVQKVLKDMGLNKGTSFGLWAEDTTQSTSYVDDMIKRYKELEEEIQWVSSFDKEQTERLQKNKDAIEAVAKALNIDINALTAKKGSNKKSQAQIEIETQIDLVKKLQDAYEKLYPFLTDGQMKDTLSKLFPEAKAEWLESFDFSEVLNKLADDLAKYDEEAAKKLKASIGKDVAGSLASAFKEIEAYKKMLDEWFGQDFNLSGEGVSFDISKIIQNLNNQYAKVDQKRLKAQELLKKAQMGDEESLKIVRETYGEEVWQKYITEGQNAIDQLANAEKESARKTAHEKVRELAGTYVKERLSQDNVDLTDFGDKTLKQVNTLVERIRNIRNDISTEMQTIELIASSEGWTDEAKAKYSMLVEALKQLDIVIADTGEEYDKKLIDRLKNSLGAISDLAENIQSLGDAMENAGLSAFAKNLGETADIASNLANAFESDGKGGFVVKDAVGLIATVASAVISKVTDVVTASYEQQRKLNEAASEYRDIMLDIRREAYSGVFGTDEMALAAENQKILAESLDEYSNSLDAFENQRKLRTQNYFGGRMEFKKMSVSDVVGNIADAQGWDLYRENGELNMEALKAYYDAYSEHLTKKQRDVVDALIASYDAQNDAAAQSAEYLTGLFSGVADNIAESMIDAFLESGDAAIDMGNIISDVSRQMVADLIKSIYLMPILNKYKEDIAKVDANTALSPTEATEQKLNLLDTALQEIAGQSDRITETIERFEDYLRSPEDEGTSALGEGIKGITEDQANLLASYLNAIRADVAYSKTLWVRMDANLQRIADMFTSSPTLMEYQAQIAANTYNTAIATQEILSQLRSVVTTDSGDAAIRVYS